jgi:hypothetical protein
MTFSVTARDDKAEGGGVAYPNSSTDVQVSASVGPFCRCQA